MRTLGIIVAAIVSPALLATVIVGAASRQVEPVDPPSGRPTALYWADRAFVTRAEFAAWLDRRGATYREWVERHPGASPWERTTASPARPVASGAADRRTEERPLGERLRSLPGAVPSALVAAGVFLLLVAVVALLTSAAVVLLPAAVVAPLARTRRAVAAFAGDALHAARALPRDAAPAVRALGGRIAGARPRPALAVGGTPRLSLALEPAPRLSLALEPAPAPEAPHAEAPPAGRRRRPVRAVAPAPESPEPLEPAEPQPAEQEPASVASALVAEVAPPAETAAPERTPKAPRLRPVFRPAERDAAPVAPVQRLRLPPPRPVPAEQRAPLADEPRATVAPAPEPAVAAGPVHESPDPLHLDDAVMCTIAVWHGTVRSRFHARVSTSDGETHTIAESPLFFRRGGDVPERFPDVVKAHQVLLDHLRAEGWRPVERLDAWYAIRLRPTAPAVVSNPS